MRALVGILAAGSVLASAAWTAAVPAPPVADGSLVASTVAAGPFPKALVDPLGVHATLRKGLGVFGVAAGRTTVCEAGFLWLQLELFRANRADSDRERHPDNMIQRTRNDPDARFSGASPDFS